MKNKIVSAADALAIVRDGDTVACSGFVGSGTPDALIGALEQRFLATGAPKDLTLVFAAAPGDGKGPGPESPGAPWPREACHRRALGTCAEARPDGG